MSESKELVFGSFSEDELKSLQRQKTASQDFEETPLRFGSVDFATLTSLGGKSKQAASLNGSKASEPSKPIITKKNALKNLNRENGHLEKVSVSIKENGSAEYSSHYPPLSNGSKASEPLKPIITKENALKNLNRENGHLEKVSVSIKENGSAEYSSHYPPLSNGLSKHKRAGLDTTLLFKSQNKAVTSEKSITFQHYGAKSERSKEEKFPIKSHSISNKIALVASEDDTQKVLSVPGAASRSLLPRGLVNKGNLCFLNATLQGLLSCSPFVQLCQELRMRDIPIPENGYPTLRAFVDFISCFDLPSDSRLAKNGMAVLQSGKSFSPWMFESVLKNFTPDVPNRISGRPRQEDAQEFLSFLMDQMHYELLKLEGHLSSTRSKVSLISTAEDDGWETVGPKNKSAVTRTQSFVPSKLSGIFGGQLRSVVKATGNKASATVQPFLLLHLDIFHEAVRTIEDALHLFSAMETLEGYHSSAAGEAGVVTASKSVKIQTLPKILILHLMRFSYGNHRSAKLHKSVWFPLELVLGRDLLVSSSESRRYELVSTITHHGRDPWKGHYTADSRYSNGQWLRYDDTSVTAVGTNMVLHDQAYVLFYKQV